MSTVLYCLLAFASWTLLLLMFTIGVHRCSLVLRGSRAMNGFRADGSDGPDWYRRATRAHANCVENLPVFASIVLIAELTRVGSPLLDQLAIAVVVARVAQSLTHVSFRESSRAVTIRFLFFSGQVASMWAMIWVVLQR